MRRLDLPPEIDDAPKLGFFPGSTIGNLVARTAVDLLRAMKETLGEGSRLLDRHGPDQGRRRAAARL